MTCEHCNGKGTRPSTETLGIAFLRKLNLESLKDELSNIKAIVPPDVANYLLNKKRKEIIDIETRRNLSILIEADLSMKPGESRIECETKSYRE